MRVGRGTEPAARTRPSGTATGDGPWGGATGRRAAVLLVGAAVLALATWLHVYRLTAAPGWDPQEGYNLDFAWNLLHGRLRLFALTRSFAEHGPLFYLQLELLIRVFGYGMGALRGLTAGYALLTCGALLLVGARMLGPRPAIWAALVFTGAPLFLANTRWGYTYAELMLTGLLCVWATWEYARVGSRRWLVAAALLAGVGALGDYEGVALVALVALAPLGRGAALTAGPSIHKEDTEGTEVHGGDLTPGGRPPDAPTSVGEERGADLTPGPSPAGRGGAERAMQGVRGGVAAQDAVLALALGLGVPLAGLLACFAVAPGLLAADVGDTLGRAAGGNAALQAVELLVNYYRLATLDAWVLLGLVGLWLVGPRGARRVLLAAVGLLGLAVLKVRPIGPSFHTAVPLLPLLALGAGAALDVGLRRVYGAALALVAPLIAPSAAGMRARNALAALAAFVVVVSPLAIALAADAAGLATQLATGNDATLALRPGDARAAAGYVLAHARPGDVALGSPQVVWMLDQPDDAGGRPRPLYAADLLQTVAYSGQAAAFYPAGLPRRRWAFDVSLGHARYVIVDDLLRRLAGPGEVAGLADVLRTAESWPAVYRRGEYVVYERPASVAG